MPTLQGKVKRVIYFNKENGYCIINFKVKNNDTSVKIFNNEISVVGVLDRSPVEDEEYSFNGEFDNNPKFGLQFKFSSFKRKELKSISGLVTYLSSDRFEGIGYSKAFKIVEKLGVDALNIIKNDSDILDNLNLSSSEKSTIIKGINDDALNQELTMFLLDHNVSMTYINKIINAFMGYDALKVIKLNPYVLVDKIDRFGFKKADNLALSMGFNKNDKVRVQALIIYALTEYIYSNGNTYIDLRELHELLNKYVEENIAYDEYLDNINYLVEIKKIYVDIYKRVFLYYMYNYEIELSKEILSFALETRKDNKKKTFSKGRIDSCFNKVVEESLIELSPLQKKAIKEAFTKQIVIITGGPGTGKTTIVKEILRMYYLLNNGNALLSTKIALLAPTGRAAKRLFETTMQEASTIHRYLGYSGDNNFEYGKDNKTDSRLVIVDEASMMDLPLCYRLVSALRADARLIIVGDVDQLPSVGPGQILKDLIDSDIITTIRLNEIHRQAKDSKIISLAHDVNEGLLPKSLFEKFPDRSFISTTYDLLPSLIVDLYVKAIEHGKSIKDLQILIPLYKGLAGITEINNAIQNRINPINEDTCKDIIFRLNDKVIQLVNRADKCVMNGDIGYVKSYLRNDKGDVIGINVSFDLLTVEYTKDELDDLSLAYAISIHKSQGSEFDTVIMPLSSSYYIMLKRKLIYTAITRAKRHLILIGDANALNNGIKNIEINRNTILKEKLIELSSSNTSIKDTLNSIDLINDISIDNSNTLEEITIKETNLEIVKTNLNTNNSNESEQINSSEDDDLLGAKEIKL